VKRKGRRWEIDSRVKEKISISPLLAIRALPEVAMRQ
jgi:hypothetical protein